MTLKEFIFSKMNEGVIILPLEEGLSSMPLKDFISQPSVGMLYDLGALPEDCLNRLEDDGKKPTELNIALLKLYAAGQVISYLSKKLEEVKK